MKNVRLGQARKKSQVGLGLKKLCLVGSKKVRLGQVRFENKVTLGWDRLGKKIMLDKVRFGKKQGQVNKKASLGYV